MKSLILSAIGNANFTPWNLSFLRSYRRSFHLKNVYLPSRRIPGNPLHCYLNGLVHLPSSKRFLNAVVVGAGDEFVRIIHAGRSMQNISADAFFLLPVRLSKYMYIFVGGKYRLPARSPISPVLFRADISTGRYLYKSFPTRTYRSDLGIFFLFRNPTTAVLVVLYLFAPVRSPISLIERRY